MFPPAFRLLTGLCVNNFRTTATVKSVCEFHFLNLAVARVWQGSLQCSMTPTPAWLGLLFRKSTLNGTSQDRKSFVALSLKEYSWIRLQLRLLAPLTCCCVTRTYFARKLILSNPYHSTRLIITRVLGRFLPQYQRGSCNRFLFAVNKISSALIRLSEVIWYTLYFTSCTVPEYYGQCVEHQSHRCNDANHWAFS